MFYDRIQSFLVEMKDLFHLVIANGKATIDESVLPIIVV